MTGDRAPHRLLRSFAWLVPASERADWISEWEAELAIDRERAGSRRFRIVGRMLAAFQHALFLRFGLGGRTRTGLWFGLKDDVRFAVRGIVQTPSFSATVVLTLALGVGLISGILAFADGYLFRPLPFPGAQPSWRDKFS